MITDRDRESLRFISEFTSTHGRAPNWHEMADAWGVGSSSGAWDRVDRLADAGLINVFHKMEVTDTGRGLLNHRDPIEIIREVAERHGVKPHLVFASNKRGPAAARSEAIQRLNEELKIGPSKIGDIFGMHRANVGHILRKRKERAAA